MPYMNFIYDNKMCYNDFIYQLRRNNGYNKVKEDCEENCFKV